MNTSPNSPGSSRRSHSIPDAWPQNSRAPTGSRTAGPISSNTRHSLASGFASLDPSAPIPPTTTSTPEPSLKSLGTYRKRPADFPAWLADFKKTRDGLYGVPTGVVDTMMAPLLRAEAEADAELYPSDEDEPPLLENESTRTSTRSQSIVNLARVVTGAEQYGVEQTATDIDAETNGSGVSARTPIQSSRVSARVTTGPENRGVDQSPSHVDPATSRFGDIGRQECLSHAPGSDTRASDARPTTISATRETSPAITRSDGELGPRHDAGTVIIARKAASTVSKSRNLFYH